MRFGWKRKQQQTEFAPPPPADAEVSMPGTLQPDADVFRPTRARLEEEAQRVAEAWNALTAAEKRDVEAAIDERHQLMDEHGITGVHGCARGNWGGGRPSITDAAVVRAETQQLRILLGDGVTDRLSTQSEVAPARQQHSTEID